MTSQQSRLLDTLASVRGEWVPLPRILELKISQFGARILELRRLGYRIVNRTENVNGKRHSWYRLEPGSRDSGIKPERTAVSSPGTESFPQFGSLGPERYGPA
jgi:hypothetical protein